LKPNNSRCRSSPGGDGGGRGDGDTGGDTLAVSLSVSSASVGHATGVRASSSPLVRIGSHDDPSSISALCRFRLMTDDAPLHRWSSTPRLDLRERRSRGRAATDGRVDRTLQLDRDCGVYSRQLGCSETNGVSTYAKDNSRRSRAGACRGGLNVWCVGRLRGEPCSTSAWLAWNRHLARLPSTLPSLLRVS
jgi:hypothetical protein